MKYMFVLCALAAVALADEYYDTRYDNFDADELVDNDRLLKAYGDCFNDAGPCTPEGNSFKKFIPDAIKTQCGKCSPKQKILIRKVIKGFQTKFPATWDALVDHYDKKREHEKAFLEFINATD